MSDMRCRGAALAIAEQQKRRAAIIDQLDKRVAAVSASAYWLPEARITHAECQPDEESAPHRLRYEVLEVDWTSGEFCAVLRETRNTDGEEYYSFVIFDLEDMEDIAPAIVPGAQFWEIIDYGGSVFEIVELEREPDPRHAKLTFQQSIGRRGIGR